MISMSEIRESTVSGDIILFTTDTLNRYSKTNGTHTLVAFGSNWFYENSTVLLENSCVLIPFPGESSLPNFHDFSLISSIYCGANIDRFDNKNKIFLLFNI